MASKSFKQVIFDVAFYAWVFAAILFGLQSLIWLFRRVLSIPPDTWHLLGEISRNTNALAVLAASIAAYIAWGTNRARAREAKRSDFKDRIHWASSNFDSDNPMQALLAEFTIIHFSEDKSLSDEDAKTARGLALKLNQLKEARKEKEEFLFKRVRDANALLRIRLKEHSELPHEARLWLAQQDRYFDEIARYTQEVELSLNDIACNATSMNLSKHIEVLAKFNRFLENGITDWRDHDSRR